MASAYSVNVALASVSKTIFKARALELLRHVQMTGEPLLVMDRGRPVGKLVPYYGDDDAALAAMRRTVLAYVDPTEPVGGDAWDLA